MAQDAETKTGPQGEAMKKFLRLLFRGSGLTKSEIEEIETRAQREYYQKMLNEARRLGREDGFNALSVYWIEFFALADQR